MQKLLIMSDSLDPVHSIILFASVLAAGISIYLIIKIKKIQEDIETLPRRNDEGMKLKLQALERLTLFTERCRLSTLVSRIDSSNVASSDYYLQLVETIKTEYDYNLTQQVYVSPEIWNAITKLKDQNIYVIHHITANLPPQATASDMGKMILEYCNTPNADLSVVVLDALQYETKQLLN